MIESQAGVTVWALPTGRIGSAARAQSEADLVGEFPRCGPDVDVRAPAALREPVRQCLAVALGAC